MMDLKFVQGSADPAFITVPGPDPLPYFVVKDHLSVPLAVSLSGNFSSIPAFSSSFLLVSAGA